MAELFTDRYPGMDIKELASIVERREAEEMKKSFVGNIKKDLKDEAERYSYLSRLETSGLEGCEQCMTSITIALDTDDDVKLGDEETLRSIKVANEQMQIALSAQKMRESISKERGERTSLIGMGIAAGVTILADLGLKGKLTPFTNGAKNAGRKVWEVFKRH